MSTKITNEVAVFKLDDSADPGLAKVKVLGPEPVRFKGREIDLWRVEILEIIKPSFRRYKVGQKLSVSPKHLEFVA